MLLKPSMVTPGAECPKRATPQVQAAVWQESSRQYKGCLHEICPRKTCKQRSHSKQPFLNTPDLQEVAEYTLALLKRRVPPAVPGIMFLSGGQSELEATLNLNEMHNKQQTYPWHVSFSYARALQVSLQINGCKLLVSQDLLPFSASLC